MSLQSSKNTSGRPSQRKPLALSLLSGLQQNCYHVWGN